MNSDKGALKGRIVANTLLKGGPLLIMKDDGGVYHVLATVPSEQMKYNFSYTNIVSDIIIDDYIVVKYSETMFHSTAFRVIYEMDFLFKGQDRNKMLFLHSDNGGLLQGVQRPAFYFGSSPVAEQHALEFFNAFHSRAVYPHSSGYGDFLAIYGNGNGPLTFRWMTSWSEWNRLDDNEPEEGLPSFE